MAHLKTTSALLLVLLHGCLCQQQSSYSPQSQTKLEDIERDNLKSPQPQSASTPSAASPIQSQYLQYPGQEQALYNLVAQQQLAQVNPATGQPTAGVSPAFGQQLFTVPNQQSPAAAYFASPQQQPLFYFNPQAQPGQPQQQPAYDFSGLSYYPAATAGYPFGVPQSSPVSSADYYKSLQAGAASQAAKNSPAGAAVSGAALKNLAPYQLSGGYFIPAAAAQSPLYQPVSFQPAQNGAQYYYNSLYQLQAPPKSVYPSGVKSTTPAVPIKSKEEQQFVPIGSSNYRLEYSSPDQLSSNYGKVRLTG